VTQPAADLGDALAVRPVEVIKTSMLDADPPWDAPVLGMCREASGPEVTPTPTFQSFQAMPLRLNAPLLPNKT
jgi:hypothetical protein